LAGAASLATRHLETTMASGTLHLAPGMRVRHPGEPDWGIGQIQSVAGDRVTVNFEHAGKLLIIASRIELEVIADDAY
jgi:FKBP-type peptidyl-prolyl cis-trans isomerase 2